MKQRPFTSVPPHPPQLALNATQTQISADPCSLRPGCNQSSAPQRHYATTTSRSIHLSVIGHIYTECHSVTSAGCSTGGWGGRGRPVPAHQQPLCILVRKSPELAQCVRGEEGLTHEYAHRPGSTQEAAGRSTATNTHAQAAATHHITNGGDVSDSHLVHSVPLTAIFIK